MHRKVHVRFGPGATGKGPKIGYLASGLPVLNATSPDTSGLGIIVALHAVPPGLRISVWDVGPGHPAPADADPSAETGRGLTSPACSNSSPPGGPTG
jgi:hypothetical protein